MDNREIALEIVRYYQGNRAAGHTETMLKGALSVDPPSSLSLVAVDNMRIADYYNLPHDRVVTLQTIQHGKLKGMRKLPLVLDHHVVESLLYGLVREIDELRAQLEAK